MIRTPDQRLRVFVSSTLGELADERRAVRRAVERLHLTPVMFELGARPHPPRDLYRAYLDQSDVFVGVYWQRYGWVAPGEDVSGLEDEYRLARDLPQLLYIKEPADAREPELTRLLRAVQEEDRASYRRFDGVEALEELVAEDLATLLSERFASGADPRDAPSQRVDLPALLDPTVGRAEEIADVAALLAGGTRLVTLTGPGGVGKTRLALEAARVVAGGGPEVHFVPLAAVSAASLVLAAVADRLGVRGASGRSPFDSLVEAMGGQRAVLVLDNLEQVVAVGPELVRLLERAPGLQVLATSRQGLHVLGEHEYQVAPLGVPGASVSRDSVLRAPAVELLLQRARARGISMAEDDETAAAAGALCRRLAGLPLAIELVVPRLRLHRPTGLLERLGSALDLPPAGADLPSRQRTLRATLAWSHDLLGEDERLIFARFGIFADGATLDAAEAVCSEGGGSVEPALAGLLDKNLLVVDDPPGGGDLRIRMLEPVRDFALEMLAEAGECDAARRRHLDYLATLARRAQPFLCGPRQREWAARFDAERANVRAAIATGLDLGEHATVLRLVWDTLVYYYVRDALEDPRQWLQAVAAAAVGPPRGGAVGEPGPSAPASPDLTGSLARSEEALLDVGLLIVGQTRDGNDPERILDDALPVFRDAGLALEEAVCRHQLGLHHWRRGRQAKAVAVLEDASRRYAAIDHDWGVATVEMTLGAALAGVGRRDAARAHLEEALLRARGIENDHQTAQALQGLALVDALDGRDEDALRSLGEAVPLVLAQRSVTGATYCLEAVAALAMGRGEVAEAVRLVASARGTRTRRLIPEWTAASEAAEPMLARARRELSRDAFDECWRAGSSWQGDVLALLDQRLGSLLVEGAQEAEVSVSRR